jgi:hypothetical protein
MKFLYRSLAVLALLLLAGNAYAQTAAKQPQFVGSNLWVDLSNGPTEVWTVGGNGNVYTAGSSGVGSTSGSSTALALTAIPTYPPCVGCVISGTGITAGTTVSAISGTSVTLSAAMTVASSTTLYWGVACPTSGAPPVNASMSPAVQLTSGMARAIPIYSYARVCAYGGAQAGFSVLTFPIGSW